MLRITNFNFNGVTVRVTCTTKSSKIQLQGEREICVCFFYRSLIPGSPHSQDLGGGGDIQAISLALRDCILRTGGMKFIVVI